MSNLDREFKGVWFEPKNKEIKHIGTLKISPDNSVLLDIITSNAKKEYIHGFDPNVLNGISIDGKKITLLRSINLKGFWNVEGLLHFVIKFKYCIIGKHYDSEKAVTSNSLIVKINNLTEWTRPTFYSEIKKQKHFFSYLLEQENRKISLSISEKETLIQFKPPKRTIELVSLLTFDYPKKVSFESIIKDVLYFVHIMRIATNQKSFINNLTFYEDEEHLTALQIIVNDLDFSANEIFESNEFNFYFDSISLNIKSTLHTFFENKNSLESILNLLKPTYFSSSLAELSIFMNLITALESFHREFYNSTEDNSVKLYNELIEQIENEDIKNWLENKKIVLTSVSLPKRMKAILDSEDLGLLKSKKKFIQIVTNTRNKIAHNLTKNMKVADSDIYLVNNLLKIFLEIQIIKLIDPTNTKIKDDLKSSKNYQNIINYRNHNGFDNY